MVLKVDIQANLLAMNTWSGRNAMSEKPRICTIIGSGTSPSRTSSDHFPKKQNKKTRILVKKICVFRNIIDLLELS